MNLMKKHFINWNVIICKGIRNFINHIKDSIINKYLGETMMGGVMI